MPSAATDTGSTITLLSNTFVSTLPSWPLTACTSTVGNPGWVSETVTESQTSLDVALVTKVSKSGCPSPVVSMSTNGAVLLPRFAQLLQVDRPNATSAFSGSPWIFASGAVDAAEM